MIGPIETENGFLIRSLHPEELDPILEIRFKIYQRHSGVKDDLEQVLVVGQKRSKLEFARDIIRKLVQDNKTCMLGAFKQNILYSITGWKDITVAPYSIITPMMTRVDILDDNDIVDCGLYDLLHVVYRESEKRGVIRHYTTIDAKDGHKQETLWDKCSNIFKHRYIKYDEAHIAAGDIPAEDFYRDVMFGLEHPCDIIIQSRTLNPVFYNSGNGNIDPYPIQINA